MNSTNIFSNTKNINNKNNDLKTLTNNLFIIKEKNINYSLLIRTFNIFIKIHKNINNIDTIKYGFLNIFFEKYIWSNSYFWSPLFNYSFLDINYLGFFDNNEFKFVLNDIIENYQKNYYLTENPFYIGFESEKSKIIFYSIIKLYKQPKGGSSEIISELSNINILHNFTSNQNNNFTNGKKRLLNILIKKRIKIGKSQNLINSKNLENSNSIEQKTLLRLLSINKKNINKKKYKLSNKINIINLNSKLDLLLNLINIVQQNKLLFINDAGGLSQIYIFLNKNKNIITNIINFNNIIRKIEEIKNSYEKILTLGMILDPSNPKKNIYDFISIYTYNKYNEILNYLFSDLKLIFDKINFLFSFDINCLKNNNDNNKKYKIYLNIKINDKSKKNKKIYEFKFYLKKFNNINFIKKIINFLINNKLNKFNNENKNKNFLTFIDLIKKIYEIIMNLNNISYKEFLSKFKDINNLLLNELILFILRFKMIGDLIQANEADTNNIYDNNYILYSNCKIFNIHKKYQTYKKILTTQDRILCSYCLLKPSINFISKSSLNYSYKNKDGKNIKKNDKILFWNIN